MLKYTVPSSETKNNQTKSSEFVNRSRFISIDSEESQGNNQKYPHQLSYAQLDTSNHIMERNSVHLSKTLPKDIKTRKFEVCYQLHLHPINSLFSPSIGRVNGLYNL